MRASPILGTLLLAAAWLGASQPSAIQQGGRRSFTVLGPEQGLASAAVTCLAQDADGFLWMGTENGLIRYEGGHHRRWGAADGLPSSFISGILPAAGGGLWVATPKGLVRFRQGRVEPTRFGTHHPAALSCFLAQDGQGRLWASTPEGLYLQADELRFEALGTEQRPLAPSGGGPSGRMLVPSPGGLRAYRPDGSTQRWGPADGLPASGPQVAIEDGAGRIWAGSGRTLVRLDPGGTRFQDQSSLLGGSLTPNSVGFRDGDGSVWLATQNGALHLDGPRIERVDAAHGLPFRWVRTLFRDRERILWLNGPGLTRIQGGGRIWNYNLTRGLSGEVVWAIHRDRDGTLLVGTDDGAARMGPDGLQRLPGTAGHRVKGLARDGSGVLWMVDSIGQALWLRPGRAAAQPAPLGSLGAANNCVLVDARKRVWLGHAYQGVLRWDPAQGRLVQELGPAFAQVPTLGIYKIIEDPSGRLWAASTQGLLLRHPDGRWQLFTARDGLRPNSLHGVALLPDGSAWINYQEPFGLTRVRVTDDRLTVLEQRTQELGLRSSLIFAVQVDPLGRTWASTDRGLRRLDPPLQVGRQDGMTSEDCAINALLAEDGQVWVGTAGGLVRFETSGPQAEPTPPSAHILELATGGRRHEPPFGPLAPIPAPEATVAFRIAAPLYRNEEAVRFQVRLRGLEEAWRDPGATLVSFPALAGGAYRFEVRAANGTGPFGPVASLAFQVRPPWWKTDWAYLALIMASVGAGYGLVRLRLGSLARSKAALEGLVALRTVELNRRNQELSAALGNVKQLSGLLPICANCKKIRDDSGYWNQLESYLTRHSAVDFSHGICPECAQSLYPDLAPRIAAQGFLPENRHPEAKCPNNGDLPK